MDLEIDVLETTIGQEILDCLLLKNGEDLAELLGNYSLQDFIEERYELYINTVSDILTSNTFNEGNISLCGAEEIARTDAFRDL